jgi:rhamnose utilization protein RhaD (predicted bifunctional aldolase and dehydrogenase)/NAD(P)-dependent dehydrogenase (short-subunit alcohol dehydrogenase family)
MKSLYNVKDAKAFIENYPVCSADLALRVYTSRLLGSDCGLVLHGGGNTSVKTNMTNILGEENEIIFVKGSGGDLSNIEPEGFTGLNLDPLQKLRQLESLSDTEMVNQLKIHQMISRSLDPSVEALLHVFLPHKYVDHTHADSILILTNQAHGEKLVKEALGAGASILPYTMSGFPLSKTVIEHYEKESDVEAIVILHHGIFTFAEDARTAYENMIKYVNRAEVFIEEHLGHKALTTRQQDLISNKNSDSGLDRCLQIIRGACARPDPDGKLRRFYIETRRASDLVEASLSNEAQAICNSGVLTPDHAIRTKNIMVYIDHIPANDEALKQIVNVAINRFKNDYQRYFDENALEKELDRELLDPYPILFFIAGLGLVAVGSTLKDAGIAADIGEHTIRAKLKGIALGSYVPLSEEHVFDMEFWSLQQKKLDQAFALPLQGQVAVITGGGGAIGFGIADRLLAAGAAVVISDIDRFRLAKVHDILVERYDKTRVAQITFDVTDYSSVENAFKEISRKLGGIDIVVPNAGIAHVAKIEDLNPEKLDQVIAVNLKGTFTVIKAVIPIFKRQGTGGNVIVISSKNVFDPGAAFGAYSAAKAGAHQISKIAALELAEFGVRVNMVNPDAVFGDENVCSNLWEEVGPERMKSRGLDPEGLKEYYCQRSLLKQRVLSEHVGNAVVFFASDLTPTTGATIPVDAGNPATFSR